MGKRDLWRYNKSSQDQGRYNKSSQDQGMNGE